MNKHWVERELMPKSGVAWFKLDENNGNIADSKGSFVGTSYNLNYQGEEGIKFNGSGSFIDLNAPVLPTGAISIYFEMRRGTANPIEANEFIIANVFGTAERGIRIDLSSSVLCFRSTYGTSGKYGFTYTVPKGVVCDNEWHKILFTWDGGTGNDSIKIYVDDLSKPFNHSVFVALTVGNNSRGTRNLSIGRSPNSSSEPYRPKRYFSGSLRNIQIYNEVIDPIAKFNLIKANNNILTVTDGALTATDLIEPLTVDDYGEHGIIGDFSLTKEDFNGMGGEAEVLTYSEGRSPTIYLNTLPFRPIDLKPFSILTWTDNEGATSSTLDYTYNHYEPKWLEIETEPFSPLELLNQEDEFEVLTWSNRVEERVKQVQGIEEEIDSGKLFKTTLDDFMAISNINIK